MTERPADLFSVSHLFNTTLINIYAQIQTFLEFTNFQAARDKQTTNHKDKKKNFHYTVILPYNIRTSGLNCAL